MAKATTPIYSARKKCTGSCGKTRVITKFRLLKSGYRQGMCLDCERAYERQRWHDRSKESKAHSGRPSRRRRAAAAA